MFWMFPAPPAQPPTPCNLLHQPLSLSGQPHVLLRPYTASSTLNAVLPPSLPVHFSFSPNPETLRHTICSCLKAGFHLLSSDRDTDPLISAKIKGFLVPHVPSVHGVGSSRQRQKHTWDPHKSFVPTSWGCGIKLTLVATVLRAGQGAPSSRYKNRKSPHSWQLLA